MSDALNTPPKVPSRLRPLPRLLENREQSAAAAARPRTPPPPSAEELQASAYEVLEGRLNNELKDIDKYWTVPSDKWDSLVRYFGKKQNDFEGTYFKRLLDILSNRTFLQDDAERYPLFKIYYSKGDELLNNGVYNFGILRDDFKKINGDFEKRKYRQWKTHLDNKNDGPIGFVRMP